MQSFWVLGHRVRPVHTIGDYGLVEIVTAPGTPGPPPHHHDDASEFFYVAEGALDVSLDGAWRTLRAGDSLSIAPGTVHTLANTGSVDVRWLTGWSPRGFERFFTHFGIDADQPGARETSLSPDSVGRVVAGCAGFGMILAG